MSTKFAREMTRQPLLWTTLVLVILAGCGSGDTTQQIEEGDPRTALLEACETQQGIGWLKREYGDTYCECWADKAQEVLGEDNYGKLVQASRAELGAENAADRERIVRENTHLYSSVSNAAQSCGSTN